MQRRTLRLCGAIALLCAVVPGMAQNADLQTFRVEFKCTNCGLRPEYTLQLVDPRSPQAVASAELAADDTFTLHDVPRGDYRLVILDSGGAVIHEEFTSISSVNPVSTIRMQAPAQPKPPYGGVSVSELQHPPTKKAFQAAVSAQRFAQSGDYTRAAEQLEKAVTLSPFYVDAHTNLAVQYIRLRRFAEAEGQLQQALRIGGPNPLVLTDLAYVEMSLNRRADAIATARAALRIEPEYPQAHYILGMALSTDKRTVREGLEHLQKASQSLPGAEAEIQKVRRAMVDAGM